jgi:predicted DNA-binding protein with PD1-like motif
MGYKLLNNGSEKTYAMILQYGDEPIAQLKALAAKEKLFGCHFTAVGAFSETEVGFFDFKSRDYLKIRFSDQMEVLSMIGDITMYEDKPQVHAHVVLGKRDGSACGGHLLRGIVHPTLEIILTESPAWMRRQMDARSGLPLIKF